MINKSINILEKFVNDPKKGLPKNMFYFIGRMTPYINVDILINSNELVGFVGHSNISVPTSIYMYASFGIPIIGIRAKPISSIICENKLGIVVDSSKEVVLALKSIRDNYSSYQENCRKFIRENSWEKASLSHKAIFNQ